jgi:pilus assembly protein FimV
MAVAVTSALAAGNVWALTLGKLTVQSFLGEPLRAEIDVSSITDSEASSIQIGVASPERFSAASMNFSPSLSDLRFQLVPRPNGRYVIQLTSQRLVTEPFLDLVVQANWANGQLLRSYTMLFDPPNLRPAPSPLLPATPSPPVVTQVRPSAPVPPPMPSVSRPTPSSPATSQGTNRVEVRRGDTASEIAVKQLPEGVSLDQMLVAMLRANPGAFIDNNVNRLRAGVVLDVPDATLAAAIPKQEARQLVQAQIRDFNEYRRRLAGMAPAQDTPSAARSAAGTVQTEVTDQQPAAQALDRLTLAQAGKPAPETDQIAQSRQQQATEQRADELNRNLQELERLRQAATTSPSTEVASSAPAQEPVVPVEAGPPVAAPSAPGPESTAAPAPATVAVPEAVTPVESGSFIQSLIGHPLALPAGGGVFALLALLGLLRWRQRKSSEVLSQPTEPDSESYVHAEGQTVNTSESAPVSSMMYSPSQLDAGGDVDPVAEADVFLAYGRDKQAEEILLEFIRLHPDRLPVRLKLLEIYAQRNDIALFNAQAANVKDLTQGLGSDWQQVREVGLRVDPDNPLYLSAAEPNPSAGPSTQPPDIDLRFDNEATASQIEADELDRLLQTDSPLKATEADIELNRPPETVADEAVTKMDFEIDLSPDNAAQAATASTGDSTLDFDLDLTDIESPAPSAASAPPLDLPGEVKALSLDLDLELDEPAASPSTESPSSPDAAGMDTDALAGFELDENLGGNDPLQTKLSLAEEFQAIGDHDGARSLAEEVEAEATGDMKERARAFLAQLS